MKERPIIFSGEMVRALLDGRKTQTRRIMKEPPDDVTAGVPAWKPRDNASCYFTEIPPPCPYGKPGDRLWVRESFQPNFSDGEEPGNWETGEGYRIAYPATDPVEEVYDIYKDKIGYWVKPSIHMPRWASRITLEIVNVRVERLQEISEEDAMAEGCQTCCSNPDSRVTECACGGQAARGEFCQLWKGIHGKGAWENNPWVWVIEFKRIAPEGEAQ